MVKLYLKLFLLVILLLTSNVSVFAVTGPITGNTMFCVGSSAALSDTTAGGTWSSTNTMVATIGSTGIVTGIAPGTAIISYLGAGISASVTIVVNSIPIVSPISTGSYCAGSGTYCFNSSSGLIYDINKSGSGVVAAYFGTGFPICYGPFTAPGTYYITSADPSTGCISNPTPLIVVNPLPSISGPTSVCIGSSISLSDTVSGGVWTSSNTMAATVGSTNGIVTAGIPPTTSSTIITHTTSSGCSAAYTVTVNDLPGPIKGVKVFCDGTSTSLSDATIGGTWSTTSTICAVGRLSNPTIVTGVMSGTAVITYTSSAGCNSLTTVTVLPFPAVISGYNNVCVGSVNCFSDITTGGLWSISSTVCATVLPTTGCVTGISAGTTTLTYKVSSSGCYSTLLINVNANPPNISGTNTTCIGSTATLTDATPGGLWTASNTNVSLSVVPGKCVVTGIVAGTTTISYTISTGCSSSIVFTVGPPAPITGPAGVCVGQTMILSDASTPGTWSSSNTSVATVGSNTGIVIGVFSGTSDIKYISSSGCSVTRTVTVAFPPTKIAGPSTACLYTSVNFTSGGTGTWSSSNPGVGTIDAITGTFYAAALGTSVLTYSVASGGCITKDTVKVISLPNSIIGGNSVCAGSTLSLSDASGGGAWSSSNTTVADVNSSGTVNSSPAITMPTIVTITYTLPSSCQATHTITVSPSPIVLTGSRMMCAGVRDTLYASSPGGIWISSATTIATIGSLSGGITALVPGTSLITYSIGPGCNTAFMTVTVVSTPSAIIGSSNICTGSTNCFSDVTPGGVWSIASTLYGSVSPTTGCLTGASAGTTTISYTITSTGCYAAKQVTVNLTPVGLAGTSYACIGDAAALISVDSGGYWTASDTNVSLITVGTICLVVTKAPGTSVISYTLPGGCSTATIFTINPRPVPIVGTTSLCTFSTSTLSDATSGGSWSSAGTIVSISPIGLVTSVALTGTNIITYQLPSTGCYVRTPVTVEGLPTISGSASVCVGSSTKLTGSMSGGLWSSGSSSVATIGSSSGVVAGIAAGTAMITYVSGSVCGSSYATVTVAPMPSAVTGVTSLCVGSTGILSDALSGGSWASSNTAVASVGSLTGILASLSPGTADITYTTGAGCAATTTITVFLSPATITGLTPICEGESATLSDSTSGGLWTSGDIGVASIGSSSGIVSGIMAGKVLITYTLATGCEFQSLLIVAPQPPPITGVTTTGMGKVNRLFEVSLGGLWTSSDAAVAIVGSLTGVVTGLSPGTATITYSETHCYVTTVVTILPPPTIITAAVHATGNLHVYPNPAKSLLNIKWSELSVKNADIIITDIVGRDVYKSPLDIKEASGEQQINVKGLADGIYMISVKGTNINYSSKLIIE